MLAASTTEASEGGEDARLVINVGDELVSAVRVAEPLPGGQITIALPDGFEADEFVAVIRQS